MNNEAHDPEPRKLRHPIDQWRNRNNNANAPTSRERIGRRRGDRAGLDCPHCGREDGIVMRSRPMRQNETTLGSCSQCRAKFNVQRDEGELIVHPR